MLSAIAIDDEPLALEVVRSHAAKVPFLNLRAEFTDAFKAMEFLQHTPVDLLFLDIKMPDISGIDLLNCLSKKPLVIFTTAYPEHAVDSFELDAIDYLVKPIRIERFLKAVNKAENHLRLLNQETNNNRIEKIGDDFIFIKADRRFFKIYFKDILYIEGLKDYVIIYTTDSKMITSMNVKTIAAQLPSNLFARVSKSYIVNILHISSFDNELVYIQNNEIPLGQSFKDDFLKQYIDGKIVKR